MRIVVRRRPSFRSTAAQACRWMLSTCLKRMYSFR
jgi:hypothetical protein